MNAQHLGMAALIEDCFGAGFKSTPPTAWLFTLKQRIGHEKTPSALPQMRIDVPSSGMRIGHRSMSLGLFKTLWSRAHRAQSGTTDAVFSRSSLPLRNERAFPGAGMLVEFSNSLMRPRNFAQGYSLILGWF